ncbi:intramembrane metalloprotease [Coccomyxa subellipsoidea C-169]|uniref:Intramembrane metalloprotease n=1 Tax=Coccomyxa subellipsoidea (strain C-169) TaxID=574566 RepID=I0YKT5_COCSC|nr:intramembrane metalloprotease [Coccomyxa subellipsoidea C-169]EIE19004.1 intramembrane metalloprotease [Coccomyxa subellipsoidea C-169]|eukprot:XP_005643548.1 intramembrane metalloprotease [Coccomyxa subellipsoidea C-169]
MMQIQQSLSRGCPTSCPRHALKQTARSRQIAPQSLQCRYGVKSPSRHHLHRRQGPSRCCSSRDASHQDTEEVNSRSALLSDHEEAGTSGNVDSEPSALEQRSQPRERWELASWMLGHKHPGMSSVLLGAAGFSLLGGTIDFSGPQSIATALGVLAGIIAIHECGHFAAARLQGIHVTKFAIGFGPPLLSYQGKDVEYSLRAIPLGGYVAFPDDDPESKYEAEDPDLLKNRSIAERALVISAGVIANIIFAFSILFTQVSTVGVSESVFRPGVLVPDVSRASPAAEAGLRRGDVILKVQDLEATASRSTIPRVVQYIIDHPEKKLDFTVSRGGSIVHIPVTPALAADGGGRIGVSLAPNAKIVRRAAKGISEALSLTGSEFSRLLNIVTGGLQQVIFNFEKTKDSLSGPVAIVAVGAEVARSDAAGLFQFAAILNINLAVINILPLPALDGGYLALLLAEAVRGKKLPAGVEQGIMASGFLLITAVGLLLVLRDTLNLTLGSTGL